MLGDWLWRISLTGLISKSASCHTKNEKSSKCICSDFASDSWICCGFAQFIKCLRILPYWFRTKDTQFILVSHFVWQTCFKIKDLTWSLTIHNRFGDTTKIIHNRNNNDPINRIQNNSDWPGGGSMLSVVRGRGGSADSSILVSYSMSGMTPQHYPTLANELWTFICTLL